MKRTIKFSQSMSNEEIEITTDIKNFITISKYKNGKIKMSHDLTNQANIYKLIHSFGFGCDVLDDRIIFFERQGHETIKVDWEDVRQSFFDFLHKEQYTNLPAEVPHIDLMNWYYKNKISKRNDLILQYLSDTLSGQEIHEIKLKTVPDYRACYELNQTLHLLREWGFKDVPDNIKSYSERATLFYKHIGSDKYIVFNQWNAKHKVNDGFDVWLSRYKNEKSIGTSKPADCKSILLGFRINEDIPTIEQYINGIYK